ncbi:MAG: ACP phosphodiesterase [Anaerolineae bacterium]|nr:ACP phosphodiesterase [Anaerolineae bacterium]
MNWLAHLYLSPADTEARIGSVIADWVKGAARQQLPLGIQRGIEIHQAVDAFTDANEIVRRSQSRIRAPFGRYAAVLVDVFYDHFLARDWAQYSSVSLKHFTNDVYAGFATHAQTHADQLDERIWQGLARMAEDDWLGSYAQVDGIEAILRRMSRRLSMRINRPNWIGDAIGELTANYAGLADDFRQFWPQLVARNSRF